jgi:hypothetical protein
VSAVAEKLIDALNIKPENDRFSPFTRGVKKYQYLAVFDMSIIIECVAIAKVKDDFYNVGWVKRDVTVSYFYIGLMMTQ